MGLVLQVNGIFISTQVEGTDLWSLEMKCSTFPREYALCAKKLKGTYYENWL